MILNLREGKFELLFKGYDMDEVNRLVEEGLTFKEVKFVLTAMEYLHKAKLGSVIELPSGRYLTCPKPTPLWRSMQWKISC